MHSIPATEAFYLVFSLEQRDEMLLLRRTKPSLAEFFVFFLVCFTSTFYALPLMMGKSASCFTRGRSGACLATCLCVRKQASCSGDSAIVRPHASCCKHFLSF
jgi:hypothetical protein